jgi:UDP-glucose 4-epimerase
MAKVLVTGGAGFIGSHLVEALVRLGHDVTVLDNLSTGKIENLASVQGHIRFITGDVRDYDTVSNACAGCEFVFHEAAHVSVAESVEVPQKTIAINVDGTLNVLLAASRKGVKRFIFASSSSVYGDTDVLPQKETMLPSPVSPYAASKISGEHLCQAFSRSYGIETVSLRYFNVFGPRQDPNSPYAAVIPKFISALVKGEAPIIFGTGKQSRDFVYVDNVVSANILAMTADAVSGAVFNIGSGEEYDLLTLLDVVSKETKQNIAPVFSKPRPGDVFRTRASIELAQQRLGYKVIVPFNDGLIRTVAWFKNQYEKLD